MRGAAVSSAALALAFTDGLVELGLREAAVACERGDHRAALARQRRERDVELERDVVDEAGAHVRERADSLKQLLLLCN